MTTLSEIVQKIPVDHDLTLEEQIQVVDYYMVALFNDPRFNRVSYHVFIGTLELHLNVVKQEWLSNQMQINAQMQLQRESHGGH